MATEVLKNFTELAKARCHMSEKCLRLLCGGRLIHPFVALLFQIDSGEFIHCKEMVDEYLHSLEFSLPANAVYILDGAQILDEGREWGSLQQLRRARRGRGSKEQGDCDEYYDGFGRLYGEEVTEEDAGLQENVSPCPPLHPAVH